MNGLLLIKDHYGKTAFIFIFATSAEYSNSLSSAYAIFLDIYRRNFFGVKNIYGLSAVLREANQQILYWS